VRLAKCLSPESPWDWDVVRAAIWDPSTLLHGAGPNNSGVLDKHSLLLIKGK
jgi:hypothetical protein